MHGSTRRYPCFSTYRLTAANPRLAGCFVFAKLTVRIGGWLRFGDCTFVLRVGCTFLLRVGCTFLLRVGCTFLLRVGCTFYFELVALFYLSGRHTSCKIELFPNADKKTADKFLSDIFLSTFGKSLEKLKVPHTTIIAGVYGRHNPNRWRHMAWYCVVPSPESTAYCRLQCDSTVIARICCRVCVPISFGIGQNCVLCRRG